MPVKSSWWMVDLEQRSHPADTRRKNNVIMMLKRRHDVILTS